MVLTPSSYVLLYCFTEAVFYIKLQLHTVIIYQSIFNMGFWNIQVIVDTINPYFYF